MKLILIPIVGLLLIAVGSSATPAACTGRCEVQASSQGYVLPVLEITTGSNVTWNSSDIGHVNYDGVTGVPSCINVSYTKTTDSTPIQFDVSGTTLTGTLLDGSSSAVTCTTAQALPGGGFAVPYYCHLHTDMRGMIVVDP